MAQSEEMFRGESGAAVVIVGDQVDGGQARVARARDDGRHVFPERVDLVGCGRRRGPDEHEPVDPEIRQRADGVGLGAPVGEQRPETVLVQDGAQAVEQRTYQGLDRSSMTIPMVRVRRSARLRATGSGR